MNCGRNVVIPYSFVNNLRIEVSDFGRIKSYNKTYKQGNILKGSMINGYGIICLKLYKKRDEKMEKLLQKMRAEINALNQKIKDNPSRIFLASFFFKSFKIFS
jgi:hypothetical protein